MKICIPFGDSLDKKFMANQIPCRHKKLPDFLVIQQKVKNLWMSASKKKVFPFYVSATLSYRFFNEFIFLFLAFFFTSSQ